MKWFVGMVAWLLETLISYSIFPVPLIDCTVQMKAARTLGILTIQIFIAWTPLFIFSLIKLVAGIASGEHPTQSTVLLLFGMLNSALNPIAYGMTNREFRKYAISSLCKKRKKAASEMSSGGFTSYDKSGNSLKKIANKNHGFLVRFHSPSHPPSASSSSCRVNPSHSRRSSASEYQSSQYQSDCYNSQASSLNVNSLRTITPSENRRIVHFEDALTTPHPRVKIRRASSLQPDDVTTIRNFSRRVAPLITRRCSLPRIDGKLQAQLFFHQANNTIK